MRIERYESDPMKGLIAGVIGGLVGTWVMTQFQALPSALSSGGGDDGSEEEESGQEESSSEGGEEEGDPTVKAATAITEPLLGRSLTAEEKQMAGPAVHYAMGVFSGAIYGVAAEMEPHVSMGYGVPFGTAVWMLADDVAVPALGLTGPPTQFPPSMHAYALASHWVYGLATEMARRGVRGALG